MADKVGEGHLGEGARLVEEDGGHLRQRLKGLPALDQHPELGPHAQGSATLMGRALGAQRGGLWVGLRHRDGMRRSLGLVPRHFSCWPNYEMVGGNKQYLVLCKGRPRTDGS